MRTQELNEEPSGLSGGLLNEATTSPAGRCFDPDGRRCSRQRRIRTAAVEVGPETTPEARRRHTRQRCLGNAVLIVSFYTAYALIRNAKGERISSALEATALAHGLLILGFEERLGLDQEAALQSLFLGLPAVMKASNIFYSTAHFIVTAVVLSALTAAGGRHHSRWRNTLGLSTAMALVCFAVFPAMPPRLLPDHPALIDTLSEIGGFWSFQTPAIEKIADPFAAVPSLHVIWAGWVACAVWGRLRRLWSKALAIGYPLLTSVVVVATANHYVVDVLAAFIVLSLARLLVRALEQRRARSLWWWLARTCASRR